MTELTEITYGNVIDAVCDWLLEHKIDFFFADIEIQHLEDSSHKWFGSYIPMLGKNGVIVLNHAYIREKNWPEISTLAHELCHFFMRHLIFLQRKRVIHDFYANGETNRELLVERFRNIKAEDDAWHCAQDIYAKFGNARIIWEDSQSKHMNAYYRKRRILKGR